MIPQFQLSFSQFVLDGIGKLGFGITKEIFILNKNLGFY